MVQVCLEKRKGEKLSARKINIQHRAVRRQTTLRMLRFTLSAAHRYVETFSHPYNSDLLSTLPMATTLAVKQIRMFRFQIYHLEFAQSPSRSGVKRSRQQRLSKQTAIQKKMKKNFALVSRTCFFCLSNSRNTTSSFLCVKLKKDCEHRTKSKSSFFQWRRDIPRLRLTDICLERTPCSIRFRNSGARLFGRVK